MRTFFKKYRTALRRFVVLCASAAAALAIVNCSHAAQVGDVSKMWTFAAIGASQAVFVVHFCLTFHKAERPEPVTT